MANGLLKQDECNAASTEIEKLVNDAVKYYLKKVRNDIDVELIVGAIKKDKGMVDYCLSFRADQCGFMGTLTDTIQNNVRKFMP